MALAEEKEEDDAEEAEHTAAPASGGWRDKWSKGRTVTATTSITSTAATASVRSGEGFQKHMMAWWWVPNAESDDNTENGPLYPGSYGSKGSAPRIGSHNFGGRLGSGGGTVVSDYKGGKIAVSGARGKINGKSPSRLKDIFIAPFKKSNSPRTSVSSPWTSGSDERLGSAHGSGSGGEVDPPSVGAPIVGSAGEGSGAYRLIRAAGQPNVRRVSAEKSKEVT
jgi:hypothetical protein